MADIFAWLDANAWGLLITAVLVSAWSFFVLMAAAVLTGRWR